VSRALVAIGVSNAPPLDQLDGAIKDAKDIAKWAKASGFEHVRTFTDENGARVRAHDIFAHCKNLLAKKTLEQLVIFFSGHGYSPLPGHELWLLSDWNEDANEAINASTSVQTAQRFDKPQISFIADACRVTWNEAQGTTGQVILPKANPPSDNSQVDQFFAAPFGSVSQQFQPAQVLASYGVFSKEVLNALEGAATIPRAARRVVTSRSLEDYLRDRVPKACAKLPNAAIQHPDTHARWREPTDIYAEFVGPSPRGFTPPLMDRPPPVVDAAMAARTDAINNDARRYQAAEGRESYETGTGFTIVGAQVDAAVISSGFAAPFFDSGAWQVRISRDRVRLQDPPTEPATVLLRISNERWQGHWIAMPAFPGLIATALIDDNGFSSLNYRPTRRFREYGSEPASLEIESALAQAAAMFRYGLMPPLGRVRQMIDVMRNAKLDNPALAIIAAHICYRLGDFKQIADMEKYQIGRGYYTPYDLLLLSGRKKPALGRKLVGAFPFMSPGWGILPAAEFKFDRRLLDVVGGLLPSLWTMANPTAGEKLAKLVSETAITHV
jgi:uncharacterized caspase-like protein